MKLTDKNTALALAADHVRPHVVEPALVLAAVGGVATPARHRVVHHGLQIAAVPAIKVTCDLDCSISARLEKLPRHSTTLAVRATGRVGEPVMAKFPKARIAPGRYRFTVNLRAPVNRGEPRIVVSKPLIVR